jgi:hypothetical protein
MGKDPHGDAGDDEWIDDAEQDGRDKREEN